MTTLNFSFDTGNVPLSRIVDAMATQYGYKAEIEDPQNPGSQIPNPQTKAAFARNVIKNILVQAVRRQEFKAAGAAHDATRNDIYGTITPINLT